MKNFFSQNIHTINSQMHEQVFMHCNLKPFNHNAKHKSQRPNLNFYRPQTKLRKGYVFTPVCHSVHKGVSAPVHAGIHIPWDQTHPPGADTPRKQTPPRTDTPRSRQLLLWTVHILMECILVTGQERLI